MPILITADLHLDDNSRNDDRWNLLPWLGEQIKKYKVKELIVCGDLTNAKDRHPAIMTNKFVDGFADLAKLTNVYLIRGNHDYISEDFPFFMFMRRLASSLDFIRKPTRVKSDEGNLLLLPNTKNWEAQWKDLDFKPFDYIFTHQTFDGAKAENGQELRGIPPSFFKAFKGQVWSGDIHVPQKISKNITYVGAPYRVHFGDAFTPRVVLLRKGEVIDLHPPIKSRELALIRTLRDLEKYDWVMGTQVKTRVLLKRSEYPEWPALKRSIQKLCAARGWEECGTELKALKSPKADPDDDIEVSSIVPEDRLNDYARQNKLSKELRTVGANLLKEAQ